MNELLSEPILYISTILFSIIAYIGKDLISKLEEVRKEINHMDKNIGILLEKMNNTDSRVARLDEKIAINEKRFEEKLIIHEKEISKLREKCHELGNGIAVYQLRILELEGKK